MLDIYLSFSLSLAALAFQPSKRAFLKSSMITDLISDLNLRWGFQCSLY
jgi:hypothetical protein